MSTIERHHRYMRGYFLRLARKEKGWTKEPYSRAVRRTYLIAAASQSHFLYMYRSRESDRKWAAAQKRMAA